MQILSNDFIIKLNKVINQSMQKYTKKFYAEWKQELLEKIIALIEKEL